MRRLTDCLGKWMHRIGILADKLVYPDTGACVYCNREGLVVEDGLCPDCRKKEEAQRRPSALAYHGALVCYAPFFYAGVVQDLILRYKFKNARWMASYMAKKMWDSLKDLAEFDVITCVPLHKKRRKWRGYNQARLLAEEISRLSGKPYREMLFRQRNTKQQSLLSAAERLENVKDAFVPILGADVGGKRVLLVDDVTTTGSTLLACNAALKKLGVKRVEAAVFAVPEEEG